MSDGTWDAPFCGKGQACPAPRDALASVALPGLGGRGDRLLIHLRTFEFRGLPHGGRRELGIRVDQAQDGLMPALHRRLDPIGPVPLPRQVQGKARHG